MSSTALPIHVPQIVYNRGMKILSVFALLLLIAVSAVACSGDGDECFCPQGGAVVWLASWTCNQVTMSDGSVYMSCDQDYTCYQDDLLMATARHAPSRLTQPYDVDFRRGHPDRRSQAA